MDHMTSLRAFFSLCPNEMDGFYDFLKLVKYPDGYAANISRLVNAKNGRLSGLKSHNCHVLLQQILPIGLREFADKDISIVLFELGNFFQDLCSRTLKQSELEKLEKRIVLILCKRSKVNWTLNRMVLTMQKATRQRMPHICSGLDSLKGNGPIRTGW